MKIKYIGAQGPVYVNIDGAEVLFEKGKAVEVPDAVAGRPPVPRLRDAMLEHRAAVEQNDHNLARKLNDEITSLDYGEGLLAQDETWVPVGKPKDGDQ